jgi:DNA-binding transcriptional MocR family regulator
VLITLTDSGYRKQLETVRLRLAEEMAKTIARLESLDIQPWLVPQAGMFPWCRLQAVAELCGLESEAKLLERKQQLVSTAAKRGISADRFESLFSSGLAETKRKLAAASPQQREQTCEQLAKFRAM